MLVPDTIKRQSTCLLEVDAIASDILNRKEVKGKLFDIFHLHTAHILFAVCTTENQQIKGIFRNL